MEAYHEMVKRLATLELMLDEEEENTLSEEVLEFLMEIRKVMGFEQ